MAAPYPQLVTGIFLIEPGENRAARLLRFNRATIRFEPIEWPVELAALRQCSEQSFKGERDEAKMLIERAGDTLSDDTPGIVLPIPDITLLKNREFPHALSFAAYVVVTFDIDFIKEQFIPQLAARYFTSGDGLDYNLTIVSRSDPEKIIYQSSPEIISSSGDATTNIFGVRMDMPTLAEGMTEDVEKLTEAGEKRDRVAVKFFWSLSRACRTS